MNFYITVSFCPVFIANHQKILMKSDVIGSKLMSHKTYYNNLGRPICKAGVTDPRELRRGSQS